MFSANDERVIAMLAGRKMDQTPTLQFSCSFFSSGKNGAYRLAAA